jgi:membrane-associated phospholipid phosphatase
MSKALTHVGWNEKQNPGGHTGLGRGSAGQAGLLEPLEARRLMSVDAVLQWNDEVLDAVRAARTPPAYAARNMAIVHAAVYDAVRTAVGGGGAPYLSKRNGPKGASPEAAAASAAHAALAALYPARQAVVDSALAWSLAGVPDGPRENKGLALGRSAAKQLLKARADDGADAVVAYTPGTGPQDWQPTPPAFAPALLPQWPDVTPFAVKRGNQFRPGGPPDITSAAFAAAFNQVKSLGAATGSTRTPEQTQIALFWADGAGTATPPGHWNVIAQDVAEARENTLAENARLFALLNIAMADAGIAAWDAKYEFNLCRPVTAIRDAAADGNPLTEADPAWSPLIGTPPFPAYTSGHSTFSSAAATILARFFGSDAVAFTSTSESLADVTRSFDSFSDAAAEAGMSRIYGGIHWGFDNTDGLAAGRAIGELVSANLVTRGGTWRHDRSGRSK